MYVIALYGHAGLWDMSGEARPNNGLVKPIMTWFDPGIKVKPRSQILNKLLFVCSGMALGLTFGQL